MTPNSCPDWPTRLELTPELHFEHLALAEARLPSEVMVSLVDVPASALVLCADLEKNVFNPEHTDKRVSQALRDADWSACEEWTGRLRTAR